MLQKKNRLQVPKLVRWQYKLDALEVIKVNVSVVGLLGAKESFVAKMQKGGCIVIPKFTVALLKHDKLSLEGHAMEVSLEPVNQNN